MFTPGLESLSDKLGGPMVTICSKTCSDQVKWGDCGVIPADGVRPPSTRSPNASARHWDQVAISPITSSSVGPVFEK